METKQRTDPNRHGQAAAGLLVAVLLLSGCQALHVSSALQDGHRVGEGSTVRANLTRSGADAGSVTVGTVLRPGDLLTTGSGTYLELLEPTGTRILVYPRTTVEVSSIFVHIGKIFVRVRGAFQSGDRDESVAGAQGTSFIVRVEETGAPASYIVLDGQVNVRSRANLWPMYPMVGPAACRVWRGAAPTGRNLTREELNRFLEEVGGLEQKIHGGGTERRLPSPMPSPQPPFPPFLPGPRDGPRRGDDSVPTRPDTPMPSSDDFPSPVDTRLR